MINDNIELERRHRKSHATLVQLCDLVNALFKTQFNMLSTFLKTV